MRLALSAFDKRRGTVLYRSRDPGSRSEMGTSRLLWQNSWASLGCERIGHRHSSWRTENAIGARHLLVFPRVPFELHTPKGTVIADRNSVVFANPGGLYRRVALGVWGEKSDWIAIERRVLAEVLARWAPSAPESEGLFTRIQGPTDAQVYLQQRRLFSALLRGPSTDPLQIEELLLELVGTVVRASLQLEARRARGSRSATGLARKEVVDEAKRTIAHHFAERMTLGILAARLGVSPFHLARIFRAETGSSLHAYLVQARLRAALEYLPGADLTRVAHAVGFSSHSHFSAAFRRAFGVAPSRLR